jgi:hypothetical protein
MSLGLLVARQQELGRQEDKLEGGMRHAMEDGCDGKTLRCGRPLVRQAATFFGDHFLLTVVPVCTGHPRSFPRGRPFLGGGGGLLVGGVIVANQSPSC